MNMSEDPLADDETDEAVPVIPLKKKGRKEKLASKGKKAKGKAPKAKKEKKPKPTMICACGCGGTTKGGFWMPGHDAELSGAIKRLINGKPLFEGQRDQIVRAVKNQEKEPALQTPYFKGLLVKAAKALAA